MSNLPEIYISVDVETAGPNPANYSLLSIGACVATDPAQQFYVELQPVHEAAVPEALAVSHLDLAVLRERGLPPADALALFAAWVTAQAPEGRPVFVAFNAPFDWMFVADYFHRFLGYNPFGHAALDMKAYFMGRLGTSWAATSMRHVTAYYSLDRPLTHHALQDALDQADLFRRMLAETQRDA